MPGLKFTVLCAARDHRGVALVQLSRPRGGGKPPIATYESVVLVYTPPGLMPEEQVIDILSQLLEKLRSPQG